MTRLSLLRADTVIPGLDPGIHAFLCGAKTWMAGTSPAMTTSLGQCLGIAAWRSAVGVERRRDLLAIQSGPQAQR